jgi:cell division protein FtsW (lipid II flippase)
VPAFEKFIMEDGIVEWATVAGLLLGAAVCFRRAARLYRERPAPFLVALVLLGLILFFGAGEEISWGQRLFEIGSPEYFKKNNAQGETNIHNLVLGGWRLNRWIFSILLSVVLFAFILLVPFLYRRKEWMRRFVNYWGVPLPQTYQVIAFLACFLLTEAIRHGKRAEILEADTAMILLLIIAFPLNKNTFERKVQR